MTTRLQNFAKLLQKSLFQYTIDAAAAKKAGLGKF